MRISTKIRRASDNLGSKPQPPPEITVAALQLRKVGETRQLLCSGSHTKTSERVNLPMLCRIPSAIVWNIIEDNLKREARQIKED